VGCPPVLQGQHGHHDVVLSPVGLEVSEVVRGGEEEADGHPGQPGRPEAPRQSGVDGEGSRSDGERVAHQSRFPGDAFLGGVLQCLCGFPFGAFEEAVGVEGVRRPTGRRGFFVREFGENVFGGVGDVVRLEVLGDVHTLEEEVLPS